MQVGATTNKNAATLQQLRGYIVVVQRTNNVLRHTEVLRGVGFVDSLPFSFECVIRKLGEEKLKQHTEL